jgi:hypothetical protein
MKRKKTDFLCITVHVLFIVSETLSPGRSPIAVGNKYNICNLEPKT